MKVGNRAASARELGRGGRAGRKRTARVRAQHRVAAAGHGLEAIAIEHLSARPAPPDGADILKLARQQGQGGPSYAEPLCHVLLGRRYHLQFQPDRRLQQPARKPMLDQMQCAADEILPELEQERLPASVYSVADRGALARVSRLRDRGQQAVARVG